MEKLSVSSGTLQTPLAKQQANVGGNKSLRKKRQRTFEKKPYPYKSKPSGQILKMMDNDY